MDNQSKQANLFEVYLRLRPPPASQAPAERFLTVEDPAEDAPPTHITLNPPNDNRRRAIEKFAFTEVFEEGSTQLDLFQGTGVLPLLEGVLGPQGGEGRDALLATLGVTGSGKVDIAFADILSVCWLTELCRATQSWDPAPSAASLSWRWTSSSAPSPTIS